MRNNLLNFLGVIGLDLLILLGLVVGIFRKERRGR